MARGSYVQVRGVQQQQNLLSEGHPRQSQQHFGPKLKGKRRKADAQNKKTTVWHYSIQTINPVTAGNSRSGNK